MSINKKSLRYILYTLPVLLLIIFPLVMGCIVYSINLNSQQLDTEKGLIEYVNDYLPFNATYSVDSSVSAPTFKDFYDSIFSYNNSYFFKTSTYSAIESRGGVAYYNGVRIQNAGGVPLPLYRIRSNNTLTDFDFLSDVYSYIALFDYTGLSSYLDNLGCIDYETTQSISSGLSGISSLRRFLDNYISSLPSGSNFIIEYNNTPTTSILTDVYMNLFNSLVLPTSSNLGLPYYLFNYMFYTLGIFVLYILFIFFIYLPKVLICLLDKSIDKLSGGNL